MATKKPAPRRRRKKKADRSFWKEAIKAGASAGASTAQGALQAVVDEELGEKAGGLVKAGVVLAGIGTQIAFDAEEHPLKTEIAKTATNNTCSIASYSSTRKRYAAAKKARAERAQARAIAQIRRDLEDEAQGNINGQIQAPVETVPVPAAKTRAKAEK